MFAVQDIRKQLPRQIVELYVVHVTDCDFTGNPALSNQSEELPDDLRQLKEQFKDMFTDGLPPGPPPNRGAHTHKISTDPQANFGIKTVFTCRAGGNAKANHSPARKRVHQN
jgi:hypothetical protein